MASKAWDSSLPLPGLIVERRTVLDGIVELHVCAGWLRRSGLGRGACGCRRA